MLGRGIAAADRHAGRRLGAIDDGIHLFSETSVEKIIDATETMKPVAVIVDSIQTVHTAQNTSTPVVSDRSATRPACS